MKKILLIVLCGFFIYSNTCYPKNNEKFIETNGIKIIIPKECIIYNDDIKSITCIKNNELYFVNFKSADNIDNALSSEWKKSIKYFHGGVFLETDIGRRKLYFLLFKESKLLLYGDNDAIIIQLCKSFYKFCPNTFEQ